MWYLEVPRAPGYLDVEIREPVINYLQLSVGVRDVYILVNDILKG